MSKFMLLIYVALGAFELHGCTSLPNTQEGLQSKYSAINPARILAIQPFVIRNPTERSVIDTAAVESSGLILELEKHILSAFKNQSQVNGVSFETVRKKTGEGLKTLKAQLENVRMQISSEDADIRAKYSDKCQTARSFFDFYLQCVQNSQGWVEALNNVAASVQNADAGMFIFVNHANKQADPPVYRTELKLSIALIDLNNGQLIWARTAERKENNPFGKPISPDWPLLINEALDEKFWKDYPGRKDTDKKDLP